MARLPRRAPRRQTVHRMPRLAPSSRSASASRRTRDIGKSYGLVRSGDRLSTGEVFELVKANQAHHAVAAMCRLLGVSASGYYAWRGRGRSHRAERDEVLRSAIRTIHEKSGGTYGVPRVHVELHRRGRQAGPQRRSRPQPNRPRALPDRPAGDPEQPYTQTLNAGLRERFPSTGYCPPQCRWRQPSTVHRIGAMPSSGLCGVAWRVPLSLPE